MFLYLNSMYVMIYILSEAVAPQSSASSSARRSFAVPQWAKQATQHMAKYGCSPNFAPWTSPAKRHDVKLEGVPRNERDFTLLNCAWVSRLHEQEWPDFDTPRRKFYWDTNDSLARKCFGHLMSLKQEQSIYSFEKDCVISGWARMRLHGWDNRTNVDGLSESDLKSLSGEAFALPPISLLHLAYYYNPFAPWWPDSGA
jgi:hypothetical protein